MKIPITPGGRLSFLPICWLVAALFLVSTKRFLGLEQPVDPLLGDSFSAVPGTQAAGSDLIGRKAEIGSSTWTGVGKLVITSEGSVTTNDEGAAMGILALPSFQGAIDLSANVLAEGSDFTALAFLPGPSAGDFWNTAVFWVLMRSNGNYEIRAAGDKTVLKTGTRSDYDFKEQSPIHIDLVCDTESKTASVRLNGKTVLSNAALGDMPPVTHVAFRFNDKVIPGRPQINHFLVTQVPSSIHLQPESALQFYVTPDQTTSLRWSYSPQATGAVSTVVVRNYMGNETAKLEATLPKAGEVEVAVKLPQGFYTLFFPDTGQEFGLLSLPVYEGEPDSFFALDTALSQLVPFAQRQSLIAIMKRCGVTTSRERLAWGHVEPAPGQWDWDTPRQYEKTRQFYHEAGIGVLELFYASPSWIETDKSKTFPRDLISTVQAWTAIAKRWNPYWQGLEVWNEADTPEYGGEQPGDQYMALFKSVRYALRSANISTPVGGGVYAYFNKPFLDLEARNGLLQQADFISFHYYGEPEDLENYIAQYHDWLRDNGNEGMPLWITEIGSPWDGPPGAPIPTAADALRGLKFAKDATEARACGIARYFPFVMVDYSEKGSRLYGMLDSSEAPLRPMATYAVAINMLANSKYLGDLKFASGSRVFQRGADTALIVYPGNDKVDSWPFQLKEVHGLDGRLLTLPTDGLDYLVASLHDVEPYLNRDTRAARMSAASGEANLKLAPLSPLILSPVVEADSVLGTVRGYQIAEGTARVPVHLRLSNFGPTPKTLALTVEALSPDGSSRRPIARQEITVASQLTAEVAVEIPVNQLQPDESGSCLIQVSGVEDMEPVTLCFILPPELNQELNSHAYKFALPISDLNRWKENSAGQSTFSKPDSGGWILDSTFHGGDRWTYPQLNLPQEVALDRVDSVLVRARCLQPATVRVMVWNADGKNFCTPFPIIKADGEWHVALVPLNSFLKSIGPDKLGQQVRQISIGLNSDSDTNHLEVSDLYLLGD